MPCHPTLFTSGSGSVSLVVIRHRSPIILWAVSAAQCQCHIAHCFKFPAHNHAYLSARLSSLFDLMAQPDATEGSLSHG
ncbi:hypothetical protein GY45DRAFT_1327046 [Cubamyces sp. BRFM 1775]|nr:hypothetical protein GY45DRAFT_1327046 [Cubamyces sp. BRFM 1775]